MYWQTFVDDNHMVFASISPSKVVKRPAQSSISSAIGIFFTVVFDLFIEEDLHVYKDRSRLINMFFRGR